jgi:ectonucleotide pyrophosphatase/phosphodiesterase family member 5
MVKIRHFLCILHLLIAIGFSNDIPTILISFDGMRYDYLNKTNTPNFDNLIANGVTAKSLIPVFPSYTFPNHYSIATGTYSGNHYLTGNKYFSKIHNEWYSMYDRNTVENPKFYKGEPIWVTAEKQNIKTASYFWVGSEAPINGVTPSIYKKYDGKVPFESRVDSVLSWLNMPEKNRPQFILCYFNEPDKAGHIYGPNSKEAIEAIHSSDKILGKLLSGLVESQIKVNIVIVSDHGMREISTNRVIILDDYIADISQMTIYGSGPMLQIDSDVKNLHLKFKDIPNINVYDKSQIPLRYHFNNENTGDFLLVADPGWLIFSQEAFDKTSMLNIKGMHGWDPLDKEMHGFFIANGPSIQKGKILESFENIYINGLLTKLLEIKPYSKNHFKDGAYFNEELIQKIIK